MLVISDTLEPPKLFLILPLLNSNAELSTDSWSLPIETYPLPFYSGALTTVLYWALLLL